MACNCGAFPKSLLTNELFGHEPGAFTEATKLQKGVFDQAEGGTLLLDEIADFPFAQQTKLLRVIEERAFQRVGGQVPVQANVRPIAATHSDLAQAVVDDKFRRDLLPAASAGDPPAPARLIHESWSVRIRHCIITRSNLRARCR